MAGNRQEWPQPKEAEEPLKSPREGQRQRQKWRKDQRQRKGLKCHVCGWVNDLEQDAPGGEDTIEDGCWTEEDDETLQLGYLGSESCLMSSLRTSSAISWRHRPHICHDAHDEWNTSQGLRLDPPNTEEAQSEE